MESAHDRDDDADSDTDSHTDADEKSTVDDRADGDSDGESGSKSAADSDDDSDSDSDAEALGLTDEASYTCGSCGEEIVVPLDASAGEHQSYVEDCPVCCSPNEIAVDFDEDGQASVSSRPE